MNLKNPAKFMHSFHRWSGIVLILLVSLKILSGFVIRGQLNLFNIKYGYVIHFAKWVDLPLLFFFILHAHYGVLRILLSRGVKNKSRAFWVTSGLGILLFILAVLFIYII